MQEANPKARAKRTALKLPYLKHKLRFFYIVPILSMIMYQSYAFISDLSSFFLIKTVNLLPFPLFPYKQPGGFLPVFPLPLYKNQNGRRMNQQHKIIVVGATSGLGRYVG